MNCIDMVLVSLVHNFFQGIYIQFILPRKCCGFTEHGFPSFVLYGLCKHLDLTALTTALLLCCGLAALGRRADYSQALN